MQTRLEVRTLWLLLPLWTKLKLQIQLKVLYWKNKNQQPPTVFQHDSQFKYHKIYTCWAKIWHFPHSSLQRRFYPYRSFLAKFSLLRVTGGFQSIILNFEARLWGNLEAWTHRQVMQWNTCRFSVGKYYLLPTWAWKSSFPSCIW